MTRTAHFTILAATLTLALACASPAPAMSSLEQPPDPSTLPGNLRLGSQTDTAAPSTDDAATGGSAGKTSIITTPQGIVITAPGSKTQPRP